MSIPESWIEFSEANIRRSQSERSASRDIRTQIDQLIHHVTTAIPTPPHRRVMDQLIHQITTSVAGEWNAVNCMGQSSVDDLEEPSTSRKHLVIWTGTPSTRPSRTASPSTSTPGTRYRHTSPRSRSTSRSPRQGQPLNQNAAGRLADMPTRRMFHSLAESEDISRRAISRVTANSHRPTVTCDDLYPTARV